MNSTEAPAPSTNTPSTPKRKAATPRAPRVIDPAIKAIHDEAKQRVVEKFPRKFGINPARNTAPSVRTPSGAERRTSSRSFSDIPPEDQASYRRQQRIMKEQRGIDWTDEEIAAAHPWDN